MKNIVVFTYGDSADPAVWSNVPYLFTETLIKKGYNVIRVDMSVKRTLFDCLYTVFVKMIKPNTTFYHVRNIFTRRRVEKKIKTAVEKYDEMADLYISISYDFSPSKFTKKKVLLFSDWPIEYAIEKRFNRKIDFLEKHDILRHKEVIENATYRVSLFKDVALYMNERFKGKTYYLGGLINSFYPLEGFDEVNNRNYITFIGRSSYKKSAVELISAFNLLDDDRFELHIIGMNKNDFSHVTNNNIYFHGYLDKGKEKDKELYYKVLKKTFVVVNTLEKWAGMSSIMEAMYYYRPVITSNFDEFVKTFGKKINFGYYANNDAKDICDMLRKMTRLDSDSYERLAINSHLAVQDYTYDAYIDKIMKLVEKEKK